MCSIHIIVFLAAHFDFWLVAKHIGGRAYSLANNLLKNYLLNFFSQVPQASPYLPQKTFYALLQPVRGKRAWQVPPYKPIYPVFIRFKFQLAFQINKLIIFPGFARSSRVSEFRQSRMEEPLILASHHPLHLIQALQSWLEDYFTFNNIMLWAASTQLSLVFADQVKLQSNMSLNLTQKYIYLLPIQPLTILLPHQLFPSNWNVPRQINLWPVNALCSITSLLWYLTYRGNAPGPLF